MIHRNMKRIMRANKFTILLVVSLLLTLVMSKPASSLVMVEYRLPLSIQYGVNARPQSIVVRGGHIFFTEIPLQELGLLTQPFLLTCCTNSSCKPIMSTARLNLGVLRMIQNLCLVAQNFGLLISLQTE